MQLLNLTISLVYSGETSSHVHILVGLGSEILFVLGPLLTFNFSCTILYNAQTTPLGE